MSIEDDLSAEVVPCDRADSHAKHGSAIMIMAWRSAADFVWLRAVHMLIIDGGHRNRSRARW